MFLPGFGFVCRLIMFTPSMIRRFFSGFTLSTRPRLPRSLPVMTSTLSFFRMGVARLDIQNPFGGSAKRPAASPSGPALKDLRRQRNNLHEPAFAQFARNRSEHARANRFSL